VIHICFKWTYLYLLRSLLLGPASANHEEQQIPNCRSKQRVLSSRYNIYHMM
jgi:hypothetical protein